MKRIYVLCTLILCTSNVLSQQIDVPFTDQFSHSYKSVTAGRSETHQRGVALQLCESRATELASRINGTVSNVVANISNVRVRTKNGPWYDRWRETFTDLDISCSATITISEIGR